MRSEFDETEAGVPRRFARRPDSRRRTTMRVTRLLALGALGLLLHSAAPVRGDELPATARRLIGEADKDIQEIQKKADEAARKAEEEAQKAQEEVKDRKKKLL